MKNLVKIGVLTAVLSIAVLGCGSEKKETKPATEPAVTDKKAERQPEARGADAAKKAEIEAKRKAVDAEKSLSASKHSVTSSKAEQISAVSDTAEKKGEPEKKVNAYKTTSQLDWSITPDRRAAIEEAIPEAKGFVDGNEIVKVIVSENIVKKEERVKLFVDKVGDRYIYLAAQTNKNPFNENASLNLIFKEGAFGPDFLMVQLTAPKGYEHKKYLELHGGTGYVTAFVGKLIDKEGNLTLDPVYDVYLPGYLK